MTSYFTLPTHRYAAGMHVQLHSGACATIMALNPHTFVAPAYDALIAGATGPYGYPYIALSELSIVGVVTQETGVSPHGNA